MSDGHVYAVASGKGGVGKTTTAVNLGAAFVEAGRAVIVVDVDLGMANLADFLELESVEVTLHDVLAGDAAIDDAIMAAPGGFDVVLGSQDIEAFGEADPAKLNTVVPTLRERYDIVLLDGGGGLSHDMTVPLGLADDAIVVSTPTEASITNAIKTIGLIERLDTNLAGLIVTRIGGAGRATPEEVGDRIGLSVLGSVPEDGAIQMSAAKGTPIVAIDRDSPAAQAYREIAYGILDEPLPRDWVGDQPGPMGESTGSESSTETTPESDPAEPEPAESEPPEAAPGSDESEPAEPEPETGVEESDRPHEGIADRLESMEDRTEDDSDSADVVDVSPGPETEPEDETNERGSFLSRLFGGLFG